ncbi:hypothetical protein APHAL10511_008455 [Amanita phalloides]|nr:hypothetical protein APHAL10511_008455 [Amanita phalloides]
MAREIQIQPLGKPVYLGQLYDATTSTFLNENLFDPIQMILSTPEPASGINYDYQEVKSLESRAGTLDISASLAVSILSGAFIAAGMGSYLDRRDDSSDSHTIAVTAHIRTKTERLDIPDNKKFIRLAGESRSSRTALPTSSLRSSMVVTLLVLLNRGRPHMTRRRN